MNRPAVIVIVVCLIWIPSVRAQDIVFDPTNFAKNVEQVAHHIELVTQMQQQIENQLRMLEQWEFTRLHDILDAMEQTQDVFRGAGDRYVITDLARAVDEIFPLDFREIGREQMRAMRQVWNDEHRAALVENRAVQNTVYREMADTRDRIGRYVQRSNAAPGVTSAVQAGNEMLATLTSQVQALQALEVSEARMEMELEAQAQAQAAYHAERLRWFMRDWTPAPGTPEVQPDLTEVPSPSSCPSASEPYLRRNTPHEEQSPLACHRPHRRDQPRRLRQ